MSENRKPAFMIVCRADAEMTVAGSSFHEKCSRCKHYVMIAPSGQVFLKANPTPLLCDVCFSEVSDRMLADLKTAAPADQVLDEYLRRIPNFHRNRN